MEYTTMEQKITESEAVRLELGELLETTTVMLSAETRERWNNLTQTQRNKALKIILKHAKRIRPKFIDDIWYNNAINEVR